VVQNEEISNTDDKPIAGWMCFVIGVGFVVCLTIGIVVIRALG
jgi:hypothetical protein